MRCKKSRSGTKAVETSNNEFLARMRVSRGNPLLPEEGWLQCSRGGGSERVSEPANDSRDAARLDGRGARSAAGVMGAQNNPLLPEEVCHEVTGWWE